ncbi:hypothetical protein HMPREF0297_0726 [Corynebacterium jeikeium ATCC 43734]|nr:hypothetical protein HMPREF0297_0726 [Corynebacterium jeikeium ATCC 43734]
MQVSLSSYCAQHSNPFKVKANGRGGAPGVSLQSPRQLAKGAS